MSELSDALVEGIRAMQDWQATDGAAPCFNWNGKDYPCVSGTAQANRTLGIGGWSFDPDIVLVVVIADLPSPLPANFPQAKKSLVYHPGPGATGQRYRVQDTQLPPQGGILVLALMNDTKGI